LDIYEPFDSQMVNFTIYVSETSVYFYYDIFHSNMDGNSVAIFENNLEQAYYGKLLMKDYFFLNLYQYNKDMIMTQLNFIKIILIYQENIVLNLMMIYLKQLKIIKHFN